VDPDVPSPGGVSVDGDDDPPGADPVDSDPAGGDKPGRVEVLLLGEPRVVDLDTTEPLRGKAMELLVYLAARDGIASQEAILEDLLPDAATSKAPHRLHTYVYNLRRVLKRTGGPGTYLAHPDRRYLLNGDAIGVDLWRMRDALAEAAAATDPATRIAAFRRAVDAYQGPLADGKGYEWIEAYRETVQRQAVDAGLGLADALAGQPEEALAVLAKAITHSPYAEHLYQAAMRAHADLDDDAAVRDLQRVLARRLDEIDTEVSDETLTLVGELVTKVRQRAGRRARKAA
jgi:two-component SAPR family response regulator